MTLPLKKSDELIDKLNSYVHSEIKNELSLKQIEREAKKLMSIEPASAHLVLGILSSLKNDKNALIRHHGLALKLGCDAFLGNRNFSVSLSNLGHTSEALEYARLAYRTEKNPEIIQSLILMNFKCARFDEALKYLHELEKLNVTLPKDLPPKTKLEEFASFMERYALRDSDLAIITGIAEKIVLRNSLLIKSYAFDIYNENGDEWLNIELKINASSKNTASLNISLAEELVESNTVDFLLDKASCRFIPDQEMMVKSA